METQIKSEKIVDDVDTEGTEETNRDISPKMGTVASRNKFTGRKDYNSRYTTKYSHGQYLWTEPRIFDLLRLYKEYTEANPVCARNQKPMWEAIASKMRALGHTKCTDNHCHTKYRTLIRQYKVICDRDTPLEERHQEFPYFDAVSKVYDYSGPKSTEKDEKDEENSGDDSFADDKLSTLLVNINKEKKEQEKKRLEKLESMHKEKMDMFSSFLETVNKTPNQTPSPTRCSKRVSLTARKRSVPPFGNDFILDCSGLDSDEESQESGKRERQSSKRKSSSSLTSLIKTLNEERKEREETKMCRLEKMHDEKMKMFSTFLNIIKKFKK